VSILSRDRTADTAAPPRRRRFRSISIALLLGAAGLAMAVAAHGLGGGSAPADRALVDTAATAKVQGDVGDTLARIFTYTPDDTGDALAAVRGDLDGKAAADYRRLFAQVQQQAPAQQVGLTTRVVRLGVTSLTGDTARLVAFLDQTTTRRGKAAATPAAAQLVVTARLTGGHWRITDLKAV
jgi:Mce-associated membrane protein